MSTRRLLSLTVALLLLGSGSAVADPTPGPEDQSSTIPHARDGWHLALVDHGDPRSTGIRVHRQVLELVAPDGRRTRVLSRRATPSTAARLADWSVDGSTALLLTQGPRRSVATRVDVSTGTTRTLRLPASVAEAGLAPDGEALLTVGYQRRGRAPLATMSWDGTRTPVNSDVDGPLLVSRDGSTVVTHGRTYGARQLRVISLADGSVQETIPTPRPCTPVRWWDGHTVLASCFQRGGTSTLSLVDLRSSHVRPLTERVDPQPEDLGHLDARRAGHTVFVQVAGPCGYAYLGRRHPDGRITKVRLRHSVGNVLLVDSDRSHLTLEHAVSCDGRAPRSALTSYDPSTGRERRLVVLPRAAAFDGVLPYGEVRATGY